MRLRLALALLVLAAIAAAWALVTWLSHGFVFTLLGAAGLVNTFGALILPFAVSALGTTPISGFVDGPAALSLASALIPADEKADLAEARPYLDKIEYLAIGGGSADGLATAKLIAGIRK